MKVRESIRSSFKSLSHNKLRSFLTMLGIIIGIFSVIMLTSIGEGIKKQVRSQVESLGANLLYVFPGKIDINPIKEKSKLGVHNFGFSQNSSALTHLDVTSLKGKKNISAISGIYNGIDKLDKLNIYVSTTGVDEDLFKISNPKLEHGTFLSKKDIECKARVVVIGYQANKEIFEGQNSIGKTFKLNGRDYKVIGILKYKKPENMGPHGEDINIKIYLPITEIIDRKKEKSINQIFVQANSADNVLALEKTINDSLKKHHKEIDFTVLKQQDMIEVIDTILGILTAGLGGIAAISLLVGGIGIMNIMLVSVVERTKEIGIRKAIGASQRDILSQFLIEAMFISILGGILGVVAGIIGTKFLPSIFPVIQTSLSIPAVITALVFAILVGIFFGVYPANKAAKLDPIIALRSE